MKKKLLSLLLTLSMVLSLAALAGCSNGTPADSAAPSSNAPSGGDDSSAPPTFHLTMAATVNENELGGQIMNEFIRYVTEHTDGNVTFETFYGGILATNAEELALVSSGAVDLIPLGHNPYGDQLPLLCGPSWVNGSEEEALDFFNYLVFENEETAPLLQAEAAAQNIVYLGFQPSGKNAFVAKPEGSSFADFAGKQLGAAANHELFQSLGLVVVTTPPGDVYEGLSRGIIDMARLSFTAAINNKWYEVAKNWLLDGTSAAGSPFTMNLDTWNSLPEDYQQVFYDAAEHAAQYGLQLSTESFDTDVAFLEEQGCTVGEFSQEDQELFFSQLIDVTLASCRDRAERLGITENEEIVIAATLDYLGLREG